MTQTQAVLEHLQKHGHITSFDAINNYGITRLSAKIFDLRKEGYQIETVQEVTKNRFGHTSVFGKYELKQHE